MMTYGDDDDDGDYDDDVKCDNNDELLLWRGWLKKSGQTPYFLLRPLFEVLNIARCQPSQNCLCLMNLCSTDTHCTMVPPFQNLISF